MILDLAQIAIGLFFLLVVFVYLKRYHSFPLSPLYALGWGIFISIELGIYLYSKRVDFTNRLFIILMLGLYLLALFSLLNHLGERDDQEWKRFLHSPNFWGLTLINFAIALAFVL